MQPKILIVFPGNGSQSPYYLGDIGTTGLYRLHGHILAAAGGCKKHYRQGTDRKEELTEKVNTEPTLLGLECGKSIV